MKTKNKPLLIQLIINAFVENTIENLSGGQTKITLIKSGVIVNIYDTGSVTYQGKTDTDVINIINGFIEQTNISQ